MDEVNETVVIAHPLRSQQGGTLLVPKSWDWQPGELREYIVHYAAYRGERFVSFSSGSAWAHSVEEAVQLLRELARKKRMRLERITANQLGPVVYAFDTGRYEPRVRWQPGWPLADL